ncbi:hypothetical protein [Pseudomonas sp. PD9R]|uniref:hypothetical protein n=1 Tax=Pseudomonas sp. PD9R TaxID=2853534 RepID=UPI001C4757CF|nr:hypothetical protein [Pseudomonas sp. PD9R]MBV6822590.1 hypothetical protein [Pseudomonas sp. PD9R]
MSTKTSKLVTEIDERVIYEDGKPKTVSLSGSDIPLALTKGRAHGDIKIDGEIFKSIESQALYFVWSEKNPGVVGFF